MDGYITPPEMASYDIVLTTYEVLKTEVYFSDNLKGLNNIVYSIPLCGRIKENLPEDDMQIINQLITAAVFRCLIF